MIDRVRVTDPEAAGEWWTTVGLGVLLAAGGLWIRSVGNVDVAGADELGLLSVLPMNFFVAVALLTVGFVVLATRPSRHRLLLSSYLATLLAVVHVTPVVVTGALGGAWAWANVGVVDAVRATGELPTVDGLAAPTEWPGVHAFTALLSEITGVAPATLAMWMPLAFSSVALLALAVLFRSITADERIVWPALWLFVLGTWAGQAHLSPLGFGFTLGLALLAVALPLDRAGGANPLIEHRVGPDGQSLAALASAVSFVALVAIAIVTVDAVTPIVLAAVLAGAAVTGTSRTWWISIALVAGALVWAVGPGWSLLDGDLLAMFDLRGAPAQFASTTTAGLTGLSSATQTVLIAGRFVAEVIVVLALVGLVVRWRRGQRVGFLAVAAVTPLPLVLFDVGAESALRAFLFALPWLALGAACALVALPDRRPVAGTVVRLAVIGGLTAGFLVAESGERGAGLVTAPETEIASWLDADGSGTILLIEGTSNWNGLSEATTSITRVSLERSTPERLAEISADPEETLHGRLEAARTDGFTSAFVLITDAQRRGEAVGPRLPDDLLDRIADALRSSDRFEIVDENDHAVLFALPETTS